MRISARQSFRAASYVIGTLIVLLACGLIALRAATPFLNQYESKIEHWLQDQINMTIEMHSLHFEWHGHLLQAKMQAVSLYEPQSHELALSAHAINLYFDPIHALIRGKIVFKKIIVDGLRLAIENNDTGQYELKGIQLNSFGATAQKKSHFLSRIPLDSILFTNTQIHLYSETMQSLPVSDIKVSAKYHRRKLILSLLATVDSAKGNQIKSKINIKAAIDPNRALGNTTVYVSVIKLPIAMVPNTLLPMTFLKEAVGDVTLQSWFSLDAQSIKAGIVQFETINLSDQRDDLMIKHHFSGRFHFIREHNQSMTVRAERWQLDNGFPLSFNVHYDSEASKVDATLVNFDLHTWWNWLRRIPEVKQGIGPEMQAWSIAGLAKYMNFSIHTTDDWVTQAYQVNGSLQGVGFQATQSSPGISNIDIQINADNTGGVAQVSSDISAISYSNLAGKPVIVKQLQFPFFWYRLADGWQFDVQAMTFNWDGHPNTIDMSYQLPTHGEPLLSATTTLTALPVVNFAKSLPTALIETKPSQHWFKRSMKAGHFSVIHGAFRGNLKDYPFTDKSGRLAVDGYAQEVTLDYHRDWPALTESAITVSFVNQQLEAELHHGNVANQTVTYAKGLIPDIQNSVLNLDFQCEAELPVILEVLDNSHVLKLKDKLSDTLTLQGSGSAALGIMIPLDNRPIEHLKGVLDLQEAYFQLPGEPWSVTELKGDIVFDLQKLRGRNLTGKTLGYPIQAELALEYDQPGSTKIFVSGSGAAEVDVIENTFQQPLPMMTGETDYQLSYLHHWQSGEMVNQTLSIDSKLEGVAMDGPEPFSKQKNELKDLSLQWQWSPNRDTTINFALGDKTTGVFRFNRNGQSKQFERGTVMIAEGKPARLPKVEQLNLNITLPKMDCGLWYTFIDQSKLLDHDGESTRRVPVAFDVQSEQWSCGPTWGSTKLAGHWQADEWHVSIDNAQAQGKLEQKWNQEPSPIVGEFSYFEIDPQNLFLSESSQSNMRMTEAYHLTVEKLVLGDKPMSDFLFIGHPTTEGYTIQKLSVKSAGTQIEAQGAWDSVPTYSYLSGQFTSQDFGPFFNDWDINTSTKSAKGQLTFDLNWPGELWQVKRDKLKGHLDFDFQNGQLVGVEPGFGRVLSLFNLDTIKRRLQLDFSDLFKKGLAFDKLTGHTVFNDGDLSVSDLLLRGPASTIEGDLHMNWQKDTLKGKLYVTPNLSGSIPVAAAIAAGNPAIGAAFWALDKLIGKNTNLGAAVGQETTRYVYEVSGTISEPEVVEK